MKRIYFKVALWLVILLICGMVNVVYAHRENGLKINGDDAINYLCMNADNVNLQIIVSYDRDTLWKITNPVWYCIGGGIEIVTGKNTDTVTIASLVNDTTYATGFGKFAKGKLRFECVLRYEIGGGCGHATKDVYVEVDIYKTFAHPHVAGGNTLVNEIVGPDCVRLGEEVTYSISPWVSKKDANKVGFDTIVWNIPNVNYYSTDQSSITFTVEQSLLDNKEISATMGKCNLGNTSYAIKKTLGNGPEEPTLLHGTWLGGWCLPFNVVDTTITITNPTQGVSYTWEDILGWNDKSSVTLDFANPVLNIKAKNQKRKFHLRETGPCKKWVYELEINRSFVSEFNKIQIKNQPLLQCMDPNSKFELEVTNIGSNPELEFFWSINPECDWGFCKEQKCNNNPTTTTTCLNCTDLILSSYIDPNINTVLVVGQSDSCIVSVTTGCGTTIERVFYLKPQIPGTITGSTCVSRGDTVIYSINRVPGANSYIWDYPGFTAVDANNVWGNSIELVLTGSPSNINVKSKGKCGENPTWRSLQVSLKANKPNPIIVPTCLNVGIEEDVIFSVNPADAVAGTIFEWYIPNDFGDIKDYNNTVDHSSVKVRQSGCEGEFEIKVRAYTGDSCTYSAWQTTSVSVTSTFGFTAIVGSTLNVFIDPSISLSYSSIRWYTIINGVESENIADRDFQDTFVSLRSSGILYVIVTYTNGCKEKQQITWSGVNWEYMPICGENGSRSIQFIENGTENLLDDDKFFDEIISSEEVQVYPNPAKNNVTIQLPQKGNSVNLLMDMKGQIVKRTRGNSETVDMDISSIPSGNYVLYIKQDENVFNKKLVINK